MKYMFKILFNVLNYKKKIKKCLFDVDENDWLLSSVNKYLYISKMVPKFSGFLSKKNSGGFPGTNSSQRPRMSLVCW